jgi:hypothetical protein
MSILLMMDGDDDNPMRGICTLRPHDYMVGKFLTLKKNWNDGFFELKCLKKLKAFYHKSQTQQHDHNMLGT